MSKLEEFKGAQRKLEAMGYNRIGQDDLFTKEFQAVIGEIVVYLEEKYGEDGMTDLTVERMDKVRAFIVETYPGIHSSEVIFLLCSELLHLASQVMFAPGDNHISGRAN